MTRRKREVANVTFDPAVASKVVDDLGWSPRPCCSAAFKAAVERAATTSGGKITVTVNLPTAPRICFLYGSAIARGASLTYV